MHRSYYYTSMTFKQPDIWLSDRQSLYLILLSRILRSVVMSYSRVVNSGGRQEDRFYNEVFSPNYFLYSTATSRLNTTDQGFNISRFVWKTPKHFGWSYGIVA